MKTRIKFSFLAFLWLFTSCSVKVETGNDFLCKTWRVENLRYTREIPDEMKPQIQKAIADMRDNYRLTYYKDGTYSSKINGKELTGKWEYSEKESALKSTNEAGDTKTYKVLELSARKFSFEAVEGGETVIFDMVPHWFQISYFLTSIIIAAIIVFFIVYRTRKKK